jgi:hypothetical protein
VPGPGWAVAGTFVSSVRTPSDGSPDHLAPPLTCGDGLSSVLSVLSEGSGPGGGRARGRRPTAGTAGTPETPPGRPGVSARQDGSGRRRRESEPGRSLEPSVVSHALTSCSRARPRCAQITSLHPRPPPRGRHRSVGAPGSRGECCVSPPLPGPGAGRVREWWSGTHLAVASPHRMTKRTRASASAAIKTLADHSGKMPTKTSRADTACPDPW